MKKDLCADCIWNAVTPEDPERRGCACLFACAAVVKISGDPCIVTACNDYVLGDPLSVCIDPKRARRIYDQLFPERRKNNGYPADEEECKKPRRIYRVAFTVKRRGDRNLRIDVGAVNAKAAVETAKTLWSETHDEHMFHPVATRRESVEGVGFIEEA